jgi:DNA polymerase
LQKLREHTHRLELGGQSLPVVVTYHPAYLLRRPVDKRLAWEDLKRLRGLVA